MKARVSSNGVCEVKSQKCTVLGFKIGQRRDVTERNEANVATFESTSRR